MNSNLKKFIQYRNIKNIINKKNSRIGFIISIIIVVIGQIVNFMTNNKFPAFTFYQSCFYIILLTSYYSICFFDEQEEKFKVDTAADTTLLLIRIKSEQRTYKNTNWGICILVPMIILIIICKLLKDANIGLGILIYCYISLGVIITVCVIGYLRYLHCVMMLIDLSKTSTNIRFYDEYLPYNTNWLVTLAQTVNTGNLMFFIVGLLYVILFYGFSIYGLFPINLQLKENQILVILFWVAIIAFIIIGFPLFHVLSQYSLAKLVSKLKSQRKKQLITEMKILNNYILLKQLYANTIMNLDQTPSQPKRSLISTLVSAVIGIINFIASVEACMSLFHAIC